MLKFLSTKEAAFFLGVTPRRVVALIHSRRLPAIKHGRDWLIKTKDLERVRNRRPGRPKKKEGGG
jgi:excisionase family DNA binding protein